MRLIFQQRRKTGQLDLEAVELALRASLHRAGSAALSELLSFPAPDRQQRRLPCACGGQAHYRELRSKRVLTVLGEVEVSRPYYLCPHCSQGQFPADRELDLEKTALSPGVRRMLASVGQQAPFDHGRRQLELLAGLEVTTKAVERTAEAVGEDVAGQEQKQIRGALQLDLPVVLGDPIPILYIEIDASGVPVVESETEGREGKTPGEPAHTRDAKLGCVFTQTSFDDEGRAVRDPDSSSYTAAIETAEEFGKRIYAEASRRGWSRAKTKVVLGDGAPWIWNIAHQYFPGSIEIVDLYHARERLWELARHMHPNQQAEQRRWMMIYQHLLEQGKIEELVSGLRALETASAEVAEQIRTKTAYFETHAERMRYAKFRRQHLFVGSGVIEAGCKTVIGARCKQSGMFWTVRGANAILALRCCQVNGRFEDYWEARRA